MPRKPTTKFVIKIPPAAWARMSAEAREKFSQGVGLCLQAAAEGMTPSEREYFEQQLVKEQALLKSKPIAGSHNFKITIDVDDEEAGKQ